MPTADNPLYQAIRNRMLKEDSPNSIPRPTVVEDNDLYQEMKERMDARTRPLRVPPKHNPQQAREALKLSKETGIPAPVALDRKDDIRQDQRNRKTPDLEKKAPSFARWMAKDQLNHAAGEDDEKNVGGIEEYLNHVRDSFKHGQDIVELAELARIPLWFGDLSPEQKRRRAELKRKLAKTKDYKTGYLLGVPSAVAEQLPIFGSILEKGAAGGVAGAITGAGVGLVGGPVGVKAGALVGAGIGWRAASAIAAADLESSLAFDEYQDIKDENGIPLDDSTVRGAAIIVGIINGSLEMVGLSSVAKTVPGLRKLTREGTKGMLKQLTKSAAFKTYAKAIGNAMAREGITEGLQELVTTSGQVLLDLHHNKQIEGMDAEDILGEIFSEGNMSRYLEAAKKGTQAGGGITTVTAGAQLAGEMYQAKKATQRKDEIKAFNELAKESKLNKENPDQVAEIVDEITHDGDNSVYVDPEKFEAYFQEQEIIPEEIADEMFTDGAAELAAAKEEGRDMQIPITSYINNIAGSEHGEFFQDELKFDASEKSVKESEIFVEEVEAEGKKEAERITQQQAALEKTRENLEAKLRGAGRPKDWTDADLDIAMAFVQTVTQMGGEGSKKAIEKFVERFALHAEFREDVFPDGRYSQEGRFWQKVLDLGEIQEETTKERLEERAFDTEFERRLGVVEEGEHFDPKDLPTVEETENWIASEFDRGISITHLRAVVKKSKLDYEDKIKLRDVFEKAAVIIEDRGWVARQRAWGSSDKEILEKAKGFFEESKKNIERILKEEDAVVDIGITKERIKAGKEKAEEEKRKKKREEREEQAEEARLAREGEKKDFISGNLNVDTWVKMHMLRGESVMKNSAELPREKFEEVAKTMNEKYPNYEANLKRYFREKTTKEAEEFNKDIANWTREQVEKGLSDAEILLAAKWEYPHHRSTVQRELRGAARKAPVYEIGRLQEPETINRLRDAVKKLEKQKGITDLKGVRDVVDIVSWVSQKKAEAKDAVDLKAYEIDLRESLTREFKKGTTVKQIMRRFRDAPKASFEIVKSLIRELAPKTETKQMGQLVDLMLEFKRQAPEEVAAREERLERIKPQAAKDLDKLKEKKRWTVKDWEKWIELESEMGTKHEDVRAAIEDSQYKDKTKEKLAKYADGVFLQEGKRVAHGQIQVHSELRGKERRRFDIAFLKNNKASTFIHEYAHYMLEVVQDLAQDKNADIGLIEIYKDIREYLGVTDDLVYLREHHEKFARSFEAYLMEGKAPSKKLQKVFDKFRTWLLDLYKRIINIKYPTEKGEWKSVEINDNIRSVFDRLLATDEQINEAKYRFGERPFFTDLKEAGFTDTEAIRYQNAIDDADSAVLEEMEKKHRAVIKKEQTKWWQEEKEIVSERIRKDLNEDKSYTALLGLTKAQIPDGTPTEPIKIAKASLLEIYNKEELKGFPKIYTTKEGEGVEASVVADFFGFDSVEDMIDSIKDLRPFEEEVEARAEAFMNERFSEDQAIEMDKAVDDAIHSEQREKVLRMELNHMLTKDFASTKGLIKKLAGSVPSSKVLTQEAKERLARKKIRNISPYTYELAQKKSSKIAMDALLKADWTRAFAYRKKQLKAFHLWKEAKRIRKETRKGLRYLKRFEKRPLRERIGKAKGGYLEHIDGVLEKMALRPVSEKEARRRKSLLAWAEEKKAEGEPLLIPDRLLTLARKEDYRDLQAEEFEDIVATVKHMETLAKLKNDLITKQGRRQLAKTINDMVGTIRKFHKVKDLPHDYNPTLLRKATQSFDWSIAHHKKVEFIVQMLDGNEAFGENWRAIYQPMAEASVYKDELLERGTKGIEEAFAHYTKKERRHLYSKKIKIPGVGKGTLTKQQILVVGLHMRNQYNRDGLMKGEGWDSATLQKILSHLNAKDIEFINKVGDVIESYWPLIEQQDKDLVGLAPEKVTGEDFVTPAGVIKGGYTPIIFDPARDHRQEIIEERENVMDLYGTAFAMAMTKRGFTHARKNTGGKPFLLDLNMIGRHLEEVTHDLAYRVPVININKILNVDAFRQTVEGTLGKNTYKQLGSWLRAVAANQVAKSRFGEFGKWVSYIRQGTTVATLGFSMRTSLLQPSGYLLSVSELGYRWSAYGLAKTYWNPIQPFALYKKVAEKSVFMRNRFDSGTHSRDVSDALKKIERSGKNIQREIVNKLFIPIGVADMSVSLPTWIAGYEKAISGNVKNIEALNEKEAIEYADSMVRLSQGDSAIQNLAAVQRGDELGRLCTMYYSFFSVQFNQFLKATGQAKIHGMKAAIPVLNALLLTQLLPELLNDLILGEIDEEDQENLPLYVLEVGAKAPLQGIVGVRDAASAWEYRERGGRYSMTPAAGTIEKGLKVMGTAEQIITGEKEIDDLTRWDVKSFTDLVGIITHLPSAQAFRTAEYFWKWLNGDEQPDNVGEILYRSLLTGPKKEKR